MLKNILQNSWAFIEKWSCTTNHKQIGTLYMLLGGFSGIVGMALSMAIRFELAHEGGLIFKGNAHMYNVVTSHALVIIFFFVMPVLIGVFSNCVLPALIGAPDMAFPRLNSLSFWLLLWSFCLFTGSMFLGEAGTACPPLSGVKSQAGSSVDLVILSMHFAGASSIMSIINMVATVLNTHPRSMAMFRIPLLAWSVLITSVLLVVTLPALAAGITVLLTDRRFNTTFFALTVRDTINTDVFLHMLYVFTLLYPVLCVILYAAIKYKYMITKVQNTGRIATILSQVKRGVESILDKLGFLDWVSILATIGWLIWDYNMHKHGGYVTHPSGQVPEIRSIEELQALVKTVADQILSHEPYFDEAPPPSDNSEQSDDDDDDDEPYDFRIKDRSNSVTRRAIPKKRRRAVSKKSGKNNYYDKIFFPQCQYWYKAGIDWPKQQCRFARWPRVGSHWDKIHKRVDGAPYLSRRILFKERWDRYGTLYPRVKFRLPHWGCPMLPVWLHVCPASQPYLRVVYSRLLAEQWARRQRRWWRKAQTVAQAASGVQR